MNKTKKHLSILVFFFVSVIFISQVFAQNTKNVQKDKYVVEKIILSNGKVIEARILPGPPTPPKGFDRTPVTLPEPNLAAGVNTLTVPAFDWSFGCTATSAAMIAGYYDRNGYSNMYAGPTNGGVMPLDNSSWPTWVDSCSATRSQCPLSATHNGLDGRTTNGHVDDYWICYGSPGPDPWVGNWPEHTYGDCVGDYMKTNQWVNPGSGFNTDGSTVYYTYTNGDPLTDTDMEGYGIDIYDGPYGLKLFYQSRGYTVTQMYNQKILGQGTDPTKGFTYAQYCAEIDAGRPVMIHVSGHTMVGVGYDTSTNLMYIHDTWDYLTHTMTWGSTYYGMQLRAVSIVNLQAPVVVSSNLYIYHGNDFTGNNKADIAIYRPSNGYWYVKGGSNVRWGIQAGDQPVPGDYNGDGTTDIAVYRNSNGYWYIIGVGNYRWGIQSGDIPVPGDYNKDGKTDIAVYRPSNGYWYIRGVGNYQWGIQSGDIPVPGDYNGDNQTDIAVYRPSNGYWYIKGIGNYRWGIQSGDIPVPGDYDGNGTTDIAIYRHSNGYWYVRGGTSVRWGIQSQDIPVQADYNGNGNFEIAVYRPSNGYWYIRGVGNYQWGIQSGDIPVTRGVN
jgi:hypothetical protein